VPVIQQIGIISPSTKALFVEVDLSSQTSVRKAAEEINIKIDHLDVLINNAGIMACPYATTEDGSERQFGTNHIGHFLLTNLLMGKLRRGSRIVTISSWAHNMCEVRFDDINFQV
jgi:NAD(P)-dependent dehydrogenase (short-subunit alcohol dehydrogenase family)